MVEEKREAVEMRNGGRHVDDNEVGETPVAEINRYGERREQDSGTDPSK
jgi:hypothetical protein